jgi:hypothetical protein
VVVVDVVVHVILLLAEPVEAVDETAQHYTHKHIEESERRN